MNNRILYFIIFCFAFLNVFAQKNTQKLGDKQYDSYSYYDAIKTYERIVEKGYVDQNILEKLGNSYYFKSDLDNSAKWYGKLFDFSKDIAPEYYYRYAQSLKAIKDYQRADEIMNHFDQKRADEMRAKLDMAQKNYLEIIKKNSGRFTIENAGINSEYSDYGASFYKDKIVFATARDTGNFVKRKHSWTGESFTNLYAATIGNDGLLSNPTKFTKHLNSRYHESTPTFTKDGKTVYFTRNNYLNGKKGEDSNRSNLLKIYKATLEGDKWTNITELSFGSDGYSVAHPALSPDEKTLYFSSNMPGTKGKSDLFKVTINLDGSFGTPVNLGDAINTEGKETFPMFTSEGELYFASDGHPGLGGLDVFVAQLSADGTFKNVQNVGEPINSPKDDFGFLINDQTRMGYFTSNREGGKGGDDLYKFIEIKRLICEQTLSGIVIDKETTAPIVGAKFFLMDDAFKIISEITTKADGTFNFGKITCENKYYIKTEKLEYKIEELPTTTVGESGETFVKVELQKIINPYTVGQGLEKVLEIKQIYFDLNKSDITPLAEIELAKILDVLQQNPTMTIDVRSHTDCRQSAKYNMALSDRRVKSTIAWLVSKGIDKARLTGRGYGETRLVNDCACEGNKKSNCSEEEHQANRRSEFIITRL